MKCEREDLAVKKKVEFLFLPLSSLNMSQIWFLLESLVSRDHRRQPANQRIQLTVDSLCTHKKEQSITIMAS